MNNNIDYIFDFRLEEIQADNCKQIQNYLDLRKKWKKYYKEFGFTYPATSDNNFRDSWFHFRKIYKERNRDEIIRQIANYEEHLQRAERDLAVKFFQDISSSLEQWYLIGLNSSQELTRANAQLMELCKNESGCFDEKNEIRSDWAYVFYEYCQKHQKSQTDYIHMVIWFFKTYLWNNELRGALQKILHEVKNIILHIRLGSSEIHRVNKIGQLTEDSSKICGDLLEFCDTYGLKQAIILIHMYEIEI